MRIYTQEFRRLLSPGGRVFLTAFVEGGVPPVTVSPNYVMDCTGPCQVVRYEKDHLFSILKSYGFGVERFDHGTEWSLLSAIYLRPRE